MWLMSDSGGIAFCAAVATAVVVLALLLGP
jgi:hypothetical protein